MYKFKPDEKVRIARMPTEKELDEWNNWCSPEMDEWVGEIGIIFGVSVTNKITEYYVQNEEYSDGWYFPAYVLEPLKVPNQQLLFGFME